jgi:hypothetical protein
MVAVAQPMGDAVQAAPHGVRYRVLERTKDLVRERAARRQDATA